MATQSLHELTKAHNKSDRNCHRLRHVQSNRSRAHTYLPVLATTPIDLGWTSIYNEFQARRCGPSDSHPQWETDIRKVRTHVSYAMPNPTQGACHIMFFAYTPLILMRSNGPWGRRIKAQLGVAACNDNYLDARTTCWLSSSTSEAVSVREGSIVKRSVKAHPTPCPASRLGVAAAAKY